MKFTNEAVHVPPAETHQTGAGKRRTITRLAKPVVSAGLIYWILSETDLAEILSALVRADLPLLLFAFSLNFLGILISSHRWRCLLHAQGVEVPVSYLSKSYIVGMFFNNFLPSTIGGDTSRALDSRRLVENRAGAVAVIFMDRFLGLLALMIYAAGALILSRGLADNLPFLSYVVVLALAGMLLVVWLIFVPSERISRLITEGRLPALRTLQATIRSAFLAFRDRKDLVLRGLGISLILQANVTIHYYLIAEALGFSVPLQHFFLIVPLAIFLMLIPISINAIGVRESVFAFFLAIYGVPKPEAVAFAWLAYGIVLAQGIIGGVIYAFRR